MWKLHSLYWPPATPLVVLKNTCLRFWTSNLTMKRASWTFSPNWHFKDQIISPLIEIMIRKWTNNEDSDQFRALEVVKFDQHNTRSLVMSLHRTISCLVFSWRPTENIQLIHATFLQQQGVHVSFANASAVAAATRSQTTNSFQMVPKPLDASRLRTFVLWENTLCVLITGSVDGSSVFCSSNLHTRNVCSHERPTDLWENTNVTWSRRRITFLQPLTSFQDRQCYGTYMKGQLAARS